jgi:hypothetical protein
MSFFHCAPESRLVCSLVVKPPAANLSSSEGTVKGSSLMSYFRFAPKSRLVCSLVVKTPAANLTSSEGIVKGSESNQLLPLRSRESFGLQSSCRDTCSQSDLIRSNNERLRA